MFKRIAFSLLAAAMTFGATVPADAQAQQLSQASPDAQATPATPATQAPATDPNAAFTPKFTDADIANAVNAPIYQYCKNPGQVALTFDDGPNPNTTPKVLDFLKANQIPATFFINGENWSNLNTCPECVEIVKRAHQEGHTIGSHTYYHEQLYYALGNNTMEKNIDLMTDKIQEIVGAKPMYFRPPEGKGAVYANTPQEEEWNQKIQKYLGAAGYQIIMWGADSNDWKYHNDTKSEIASLDQDMLAQGKSVENSSFIVLMHDVWDTTADLALEVCVEHIKSLGYKFVSLNECLGNQSGYQVETPVLPNNLQANNTRGIEDKKSFATSSFDVKMIYSTTLAVILSVLLLF